MKKLSKIISALLATVMLLAMLPAGIAAHAESGECGLDLVWELDGEGNLTISGTGYMWGYDHTDLYFAPWGTALKSVTISEGVKSIGYEAFYGCGELISISIPASLSAIEGNAFYGCASLGSVTVAEGNTVYLSVGNCLIETESKTLILGLKDSVIPDDGSVTRIGDRAFYGCAGLTGITIPNSVESLGWGAFYGCSGLDEITIPESVTSIDYFAFAYCSGLKKITVAENNPVYHSAGDCLIETGTKTLIQGCGTSVIPSDGSVTSIQADAFCGAGLTEITIPDGVTDIGDNAFGDCVGLKSVSISADAANVSRAAFFACAALESITVADGNPAYAAAGDCLIETGTKTLIQGCKNSIIPADGSVTSIGAWAFYKCVGLTSVTIPAGVTSIGESAFFGCTGLTDVTISDSVAEISYDAFKYADEYSYLYPLDLTMKVYENSCAHRYALDNGFKFELIKSGLPKGDPDGDGQITVADALSALRVAARLATPSRDFIDCCDIDGDGAITVADALSILRVAAKLADPSSFVGEEPAALSRIVVTTLPKTNYATGEALDVSGGELTLYYNDGTSESVALTADMVSGFDSSEAGTVTLTVAYGDLTAKYYITVTEPVPADKVAVTIETVEAAPGAAEVEVKVIVSASPKWNSIAMIIGFDPDKLIYKGYTRNPVITKKLANGEGLMHIIEERFADEGTITSVLATDEEEGNVYEYLFILKFDVAEGVSGLQEITVAVDGLVDRSNTAVPFVQRNGGILVG